MFSSTTPPLRRHRDPTLTHHYPEGSIVEILTKTGNSTPSGDYYLGTVLPFPPYSTETTSRNRLYVKYHNIIATNDDGSQQRLMEYVDVSSVRPAPSPMEQATGVGLNDVVDAFVNAGWWTGVVERVVEEEVDSGKRFVVNFGDESREFGLGELRVHWDWVDGLWARPEKQAVLASMYEVGERIEASRDNGKPHYSWFMAKVLGKQKAGSLLVEYCTIIGNNGRPSNSTVDLANVRPCPPALQHEGFAVQDVVDAYCNFGWWKCVISKVNEGNYYEVYFERMQNYKVFHESNLRLHMEWRDGKWFKSPQVNSVPAEVGDSWTDRQSRKSPERLVENLEIPTQCVLLTYEGGTLPENGDSSGEIQNGSSPERLVESIPAPAAGVVPKPERKPIEVIDLDMEDEVLDKESLPFYKTSPLWKTIESMDVFKKLPQKPHFKPLEHVKESTRESQAITLMVYFSTVAEKVTGLQCSDPNDTIDEISEMLTELEKHGFDVIALRECVVHLLALREKRELYVKHADEVERQILVLSKGKSDTAEKEINGIEAEIEKLKVKLSLDQMAKQNQVSELAALQAKRQEVKERMLALTLEFDNIACTKW